MRRTVAVALAVAMTASVAWVLNARSAGGTKVITLSAPAFSPREYSTHNNGDKVCRDAMEDPIFVPSEAGGEVRGDMDNGKGSFFHTVPLPLAVKVTKLRLVVNDGDAEADVFAFLVRRRIEGGIPNTGGYKVMARAKSEGAEPATLRAFPDTTIRGGNKTDPRIYSYFVELVDCGVPEPYSVQVFYRKT
jgi:hypothetical protein